MIRFFALILAIVLSGCGSVAQRAEAPTVQPEHPSARGGYYKDDGPGDNPPPDLLAVPDAQPRQETLNRFANRPYEVFGVKYAPLAEVAPFRQRGVASWYGRRFHGQKTSSGEPYDMYAMTAAHPTLPIPSYARVTNLANGRSVVVRVNDRGPFHSDRIVDLSYTAAFKLGFAANGSALVDLESIVPGTMLATAPTPVAEERKPAEKPAPDSPAEAKGVYVQLGAFAARDGAESFRARVYKELAWLSEAIHVYAADGLYKLQLGPYRTREDARPILERIRAELNFSPALVAR